jgi:diguanylate cyclase (GGDEF)-like protein
MISLKRHIDGWVRRPDVSGSENDPEPKPPACAAVAAGNEKTGAIPPPEQWTEQALQRLEANEREMGALVDVLATALRSLTERDKRYAREVVGISQRLQLIASARDFARVRQAISEGANSLMVCVEQIVQDGRESLRLLATNVEEYRSRLDGSENGLPDPGPPESLADKRDHPNGKPGVETTSARLFLNRRELREIVEVIERAVESVAQDDERHGSEVGAIAKRLQSIAGLKNPANIRRSVIDNARALAACGDRIANDSRKLSQLLAAEVGSHRSRLENPGQLSSSNLVITNRGRLEEHLNERIGAGDRFCLIRIALSDLERVSNRFGRIAGDDLLKQFAIELRAQFPSAHLVARCGADEFAVIVAMSRTDAQAQVSGIRRTALGQYRVQKREQFLVVGIDATIRIVEWNGSENSRELLARNIVSRFGAGPGSN